jgi:hypothetical protein
MRAVLAAALIGLALAGCSSTTDTVRMKVNQFIHAIAHKDYATLCNQVLAPSLIDRLETYGIKCQPAMQIALKGVSDPGLAIGSISVHGNKASVTTITTAKHQEASLDAIELMQTSAGWRVSSLGTPQFPKK